jgi:hypothetical protein
MSSEPRVALARLVGALEAHLDAVERRRSDTDPVVKDAYSSLADAFEGYDEALYEAHDEVTPFVLFDEDAEDDEDAEADDDVEELDEDDDDLDDEDDDEQDDDGDEPDDRHPRL